MINLHEKQIKSHNYPAVHPQNPIQGNMRGNLNFGQPVKMLTVRPETYHNFKRNQNVIVNPLLAVQLGQQVSVPEQHLVPSINESLGQIYSVKDELSQLTSNKDTNFSEPIYAEIKPKLLEISEGESDLEESQLKGNKFLEEEYSQNSKGKKKEIEYWQITAKEVVKFRPCTETFIKRV